MELCCKLESSLLKSVGEVRTGARAEQEQKVESGQVGEVADSGRH